MYNRKLQEYEQSWGDLNRELDRIIAAGHGLDAALGALYDQQLQLGFVRDDLASVQRYLFTPDNNDSRYFAVQFNPARAGRFSGVGFKHPPYGVTSLNNGCFLCRENIQWQQDGKEIGYDLNIEERAYVAYMNPYPLLPNHTVMASRDHIPQTWKINGVPFARRDLYSIVNDLLLISSRLPNWIGFYNGAGAGASIPYHFHYQFFPRPSAYGLFPLELAAANKQPTETVVRKEYPVDFAHWRGPLDQLLKEAMSWLQNWAETSAIKMGLTANVVAIAHRDRNEMDLYFVPRDPNRPRAPEMSGLVGGLEVLGELIFSSEEEKYRLDNHKVDYTTVERILSSIAVPIHLEI